MNTSETSNGTTNGRTAAARTLDSTRANAARIHAGHTRRRGARHHLRRVLALPGPQGRPDGLGVGADRGALDHTLPRLLEGVQGSARRRSSKTTSCRRPARPASRSPSASASPCRRCSCSASRWTRSACMTVSVLGGGARHPDDDPAAAGVHRQAARQADLPRGDRLCRGAGRRREGRRDRARWCSSASASPSSASS